MSSVLAKSEESPSPSPLQASLTFFLAAGRISLPIPSKMVVRLGGWGSSCVRTQAHFHELSGDGEGEMLLFLNMVAEALGK